MKLFENKVIERFSLTTQTEKPNPFNFKMLLTIFNSSTYSFSI